MMKNKLQWAVLALAVLVFNTAQAIEPLAPLPKQADAALLSAKLLDRYHYRHVALDDALSARIFDNYLKALDADKVIFTQADIDRFAYARTKLDDAILDEDLGIPFAIFNLYLQRISERLNYARSLLPKGFDFKRNESYQYMRKDAPWPKSTSELDELWRKRVKNDWLRLKLAGKNSKGITETLDKRYSNSLSGLAKVKSEDVFQNFMNAYAMTIDPHTNYLGVRASEEFDISMKLSLMGIGAVLNSKDDYTVIRELVAGGPAALSGKLKAGDRIVGVGQGENAPIVDIMGWRLDDAVAIIRGEEDSVVVLDILPADVGADGKHTLVSLVRKKISLEKQSAQKKIIEVKESGTTRRIGVITLPAFYEDFDARHNGDKNYKSATRDVSRLLEELKKDKVDGVLMDMRNNGGGALSEAIEMTGLFIDKGPVVQQRNSDGKISVGEDTTPGVVWDGPLGVLISRGSASATEIFAAAIQDYGRGVVIGEPSFGKGTVQTVANLDEIAKNDKPVLGEIKMTIAQFFRVNGGTTQLRGVTPDISLPSVTDATEFGESSFDNALPWTQIQAANYMPAGDVSAIVPKLIAVHNRRISHDREFQYLREDIAETNKLRKRSQISLNEDDRRKEREAQEARDRLREKNRADGAVGKALAPSSSNVLQDDGMLPSERNLSADLAIEAANKNTRDIWLDEAAHIVSDDVGLQKNQPKVAASRG